MRIGRLAILAIAFGVLVGALGAADDPPAAGPLKVTVLFFNDIHGHLLPFTVRQPDGTKAEVGGVARLASLIRKVAAENHRIGGKTVTLIAGDILQGTPMSTVFHGKPDVEIFNAIAIDAMTVGNHEFDFGLDNFLELREAGAIPVPQREHRVEGRRRADLRRRGLDRDRAGAFADGDRHHDDGAAARRRSRRTSSASPSSTRSRS